jgi:hypothetical protein
VRDRLLAGAEAVQPRYLHLRSKCRAPCEVVGLASAADVAGTQRRRKHSRVGRDGGAVAGRARP